MGDNSPGNKNVNNEVDVMYKKWLERMVLSKTWENELLEMKKDTQKIRLLLDESEASQ